MELYVIASNGYRRTIEHDISGIVSDSDERTKRKIVMRIPYGAIDSMSLVSHWIVFENINRVCISEICEHFGVKFIYVSATLPTSVTEEQARKIILDRVAKFKAERAGL